MYIAHATDSMERIPSWEANNSSTSKTSHILRKQKVHCYVHKIRYLYISWARRIQSAPWYPVSLRSRLCLGLPNGLLPSDFRQPHYISKPMKLRSLPVRLQFLCLFDTGTSVSFRSVSTSRFQVRACFCKSTTVTNTVSTNRF